MGTLLLVQQDLRVIRLTEEDAAQSTDPLCTFSEQLAPQDEMYPGISKWFRDKVVPGLRDGSRVAYLGFEGEKPILTAVVRRGEHAKFCHLRIAEEFQDLHLGEIFFSMMALEVRKTAKDIHFSLPESLWFRRRGFFSSFGFRDVVRARTQYRPSEEELCTSASFVDVWRATRQRLTRLTSHFSNAHAPAACTNLEIYTSHVTDRPRRYRTPGPPSGGGAAAGSSGWPRSLC